VSKKVYIVGAHSRARTLGIYLKKIYTDLEIAAYLVNNDEDNPEIIDGVPVIRFDDNTDLDADTPVYIGTRGIYHPDLIEILKKCKMKKIIPVTPQLDMELRNRYLKQYFSEEQVPFLKLNELNGNEPEKENKSVCIYVAKSAADKRLNKTYDLKWFEKEIQVGAVLTEKKICNLTDDNGENISSKNKQFCELTALYWIWRNAKEDIVGLEHYRRHFILQDDWADKMLSNQVDVVLPVPLYVAPSLEENYKERHTPDDWEYMMQCLQELYPDYYETAKVFFNKNLYSPCNMFIMKKEVLDEFCLWLFPILFRCEEHIGYRDDVYQNRYPGFLSERLMTLYFEKNRDKYKVVYADKDFRE